MLVTGNVIPVLLPASKIIKYSKLPDYILNEPKSLKSTLDTLCLIIKYNDLTIDVTITH